MGCRRGNIERCTFSAENGFGIEKQRLPFRLPVWLVRVAESLLIGIQSRPIQIRIVIDLFLCSAQREQFLGVFKPRTILNPLGDIAHLPDDAGYRERERQEGRNGSAQCAIKNTDPRE